MEKIVKQFASMYGKALIACGNQAADVKIAAFAKRLEQMYASDIFKQHNVYPSMGVDRIYAVIAVCLELKDDGMLTDEFAYRQLTRHVEFIRYSDLSDGNCCHDEIIDRKRKG